MLDPLGALLGQRDCLDLFVFFIVVGAEPGDQLVYLHIKFRLVFGRPGNDQRRPRFVDQDTVNLVDDRKIERSLNHILELERQIVAQVIKAKFIVGSVSDIGRIGSPAVVF